MPAMLSRLLRAGTVVLVLGATLDAQTTSQRLTTPNAHFGHEIGADYVLPDYTQFAAVTFLFLSCARPLPFAWSVPLGSAPV